jgi:hypothetical protein
MYVTNLFEITYFAQTVELTSPNNHLKTHR